MHWYGESVLGTWETSYKAIAKQNPAAARLLSLLAFINFKDIFPGLIGKDDNGTLARGPGCIIGELVATILAHQTWRLYLSSEQKLIVYDLEAYFETLHSYSLL